MTADQLRNRTVGSKMTASEYEQLVAVAEREGLTLGEWCRKVLLTHANSDELDGASLTERTLLAEVLALRTILLNLHFAVSQEQTLTAEEMQRLIDRADQDKLGKARQRLAEAVGGCHEAKVGT